MIIYQPRILTICFHHLIDTGKKFRLWKATVSPYYRLTLQVNIALMLDKTSDGVFQSDGGFTGTFVLSICDESSDPSIVLHLDVLQGIYVCIFIAYGLDLQWKKRFEQYARCVINYKICCDII